VAGAIVRLLTCGSVDDGKSTLIGRLLVETDSIPHDTIGAARKVRRSGSTIPAGEIDFSLLTDGLEAEREQGITIDVAYRSMTLLDGKRLIISDAPGHEQYTRNMVTGASTADAVIILIDVSKVKVDEQGKAELLIQTKRHSTIAQLLQIQHVIVAVNKMDLVNYDRAVYDRIVTAYQEFAASLGLKDIHTLPMSALAGDNVVVRSEQMDWYQGPTLIELLESLSVYDDEHAAALRFPVQLVARHNGHEAQDFRGYMGRIEAGSVRKGDKVMVQPSGQQGTVKDIVTLDGSLDQASAGKSVTILLEEYLDISRGDMLVAADAPAALLKNFSADVCWLSEEPLDLRRRYWLKHTTRQVAAKVSNIEWLLDINTQQRGPATELKLNGIGRLGITVQQALAADGYQQLRATGSFILIDEISHQTVAAGMIRLD
jgi:sulfate adenylyltransferase subunit 1